MNKIKIALTLCFLLLSAAPSQVSAFPASAPTVTSVSPTQAYNYQATTITISGTNFVATPTAPTVMMGNVSLANVTFVNDTMLTATVPADLPGGAYTITVTNQDSQSGSLASAFTVMLSGDGNLSSWQTTTSMVTGRSTLAAVATNGFVYAIGGGTGSAPLSSVERAAIGSDGSLGSWQTTTSMNTARYRPAAVAANGCLYVFGGGIGGLNLDIVERASINPDGSLGSWQTLTSMNTSRYGPGAVVAGSYVYVIGGSTNSSGITNSVERAAINGDGTLGTWQYMTSMVKSRFYHAAVVANGYIYALSGSDNSGGGAENSVERAAINPDGTLGSWQFN